MVTLLSEMVGHSPFLPDPAAAYVRQCGGDSVVGLNRLLDS